ncbi:hypothetical protein TVAG_108250 [Trichomonas vaginalis G3]|uniref:Uncharacterized protein n=1 Tax=Trichomonas vaginalis (strain ATCC PRA-98 / G3) TaxID=412133 RepID=A2EQE9_TRIV3|nr:hypothetical protein TVAGG3_0214600 [Trichomonas vaginalis G3]EAY05091.1 hypothetical protein TVAG_108250 [Trichomonas vaginalis G3]KAI5551479.1 hypothetical protein TVAGG3_0214600 [Trichomonas vaginalis G3]|eukprot:XP_001317314.1 hypothetical protein [Trichomonas vaginalis G3]
MNVIFLMIVTMLSTLTQLTTHYSCIIAAFLVIALQKKKEVAFTTKLAEIVPSFNENSAAQNVKARELVNFLIQKLREII